VLAVDRLPDALERGRLTAGRLLGADAGRVEWLCADSKDAPIPEPVDLVLMILFLDRAGLRRATDRLRPGGAVLLEVFTPTYRSEKGKPRDPDLVLDAEGARHLLAGLNVELAEETRRGERHTLRVAARRV
jgi:SAM-dependent methyltransferase